MLWNAATSCASSGDQVARSFLSSTETVTSESSKVTSPISVSSSRLSYCDLRNNGGKTRNDSIPLSPKPHSQVKYLAVGHEGFCDPLYRRSHIGGTVHIIRLAHPGGNHYDIRLSYHQEG